MTASAKSEQGRTGPSRAARVTARLCLSKRGACLLPCVFFLFAVAVFPSIAGAQVSQPSRTGADAAYSMQLNADMVILSATVLDRHNAPVSGLSKDDFQVYEDGLLQQIQNFSHDDIPITAGILVDNSGSMAPKRDDVIAAALAFAHSSNPQDQMFVVNFNDYVSFGLPPNIPFTDRQEELRQALSGFRPNGMTALYDGIAVALDHLKQGGHDKKVLILISDGGDSASKRSLAQVLDMAKHSAVIIYALGIFDEQDGDQNPGVLKKLAKETGGEAFFPESSRDAASICEEIARDIRSQYTLTYIPANVSQDGRYRAIEVRASAPGRGRLPVRTRAGYFVPLHNPDSAGKGTQP